MFIEQRINKFSESNLKHNWFSDAVDRGLNSVGINKQIRDDLQPIIDDAKNLLPRGGAIIPPENNVASIPQATGYKYGSNISPIVLFGAALLVALAVMKRK